MYKWPQGRVIRIVCLILSAIVVADLVYHGAYGQFAAWQTAADQSAGFRQLILAIFFTLASTATAIAAVVAVGFHKVAVDFLIDVEFEMTKVEWPKVDSLWKSTLVIALTILIMAATIFLADWLILTVLDRLFTLGVYL